MRGMRPRTWAAIALLVLLMVLVLSRCGGGGGRDHLVLADDRDGVFVVAASISPDADLETDQRIGRSTDVASSDTISVYRDNRAGVPTWAASSPVVMSSSGQRLTLIDDRRPGLTLERGSVNAELGDGEDLASGDLERVVYYPDEDILYFQEQVTGDTQSCHVSRSGGEPVRIGTGNSCRLWLAADLVEVRTAREATLFGYDGEERLELDLRRFDVLDLRVVDEGRSIVSTLRATDGVTELLIGTIEGDQTFVTRNDEVRVLDVSPLTDSFLYAEREAGEATEVLLYHGNDSTIVGSGEVLHASIAPDGSEVVVALLPGSTMPDGAAATGRSDDDVVGDTTTTTAYFDDDEFDFDDAVDDYVGGEADDLDDVLIQTGVVEVWFADLTASDLDFELIHQADESDISDVTAYWIDAESSQMVLAVDGWDERDSFTELRDGSETTSLTHATYGQGAMVPVGSSWVWLSQQSTGSDGYAVVELVRDNEVVVDEVLEGELYSAVVVNDRTISVILDRDGTRYLTMVSLEGDDIEVLDLMASSWIDNLTAVSGRLFARNDSRGGLQEVVTARPGDTDVEPLGGDAARIVGVLSRDLPLYSQGR